MIKVIIIAPVMAVRVGLRTLLSDDQGIEVVAEGASLDDMEPSQHDVDLVLWSPAPYQDSETLQLELSSMKVREASALLLIHSDPKVMEQLSRLPLRAWGLVDPEATQAELVASIKAVNEGLVVANPSWINLALSNHATTVDESQNLIEPLTEREIEILQLLAYGLTNKQIAARLKISAHTVKFHVSAIFTKMGTTNRVETVNLGVKKGLIVL